MQVINSFVPRNCINQIICIEGLVDFLCVCLCVCVCVCVFFFFFFFFSSNRFWTQSTFLKVGNFYIHLIRREDCRSRKVHGTIDWHPKKSTCNDYETWWEIENPPTFAQTCLQNFNDTHNMFLNPDIWTIWHIEKDKTHIFTQNMFEKNTKLIESPEIGIQSYKQRNRYITSYVHIC